MSRPPLRAAILQVTPELDAGGVEQTTLDVAEAIVRAGGRALVASAGGRLEPDLRSRGGELFRMPVQSRNPLIMMGNAGRLRDLIARERVGLVHVRSRAPAFSALAAARGAGVPSVTTYHGLYSAGGPLKRWYNGVMARGDLVIANSVYTRDHVIAEHGAHPAKIIAIPRGVDLRRFDPSVVTRERVEAVRASWRLERDDPRPVILLAGRLTRWKGQALLIDALRRWPAARQPGHEPVLVLAGDAQGREDYGRELAAQGASAGLGDRVRIVGHCADMPAAYLACDVACAPSLRPEAFGRTAVEPQAMGRPVLAADHGAARETVDPGVTGWLVEPGSPEAWSRALARALAAPPEVRAAMGRAGRERVATSFSVEAMTAATLSVYERLLGR